MIKISFLDLVVKTCPHFFIGFIEEWFKNGTVHVTI